MRREAAMDDTPQESTDIEQKIADAAKVETLQEQIVAALKTCYDPEIPVDIYELGLIYGIEVDHSGAVVLRMTLTSPMCPAAESLPPEVQRKVQAIPGVTSAKVDIVWEPVWTMDRMSEPARLKLGLDY
jgi:FeS assembly SUF system protein